MQKNVCVRARTMHSLTMPQTDRPDQGSAHRIFYNYKTTNCHNRNTKRSVSNKREKLTVRLELEFLLTNPGGASFSCRFMSRSSISLSKPNLALSWRCRFASRSNRPEATLLFFSVMGPSCLVTDFLLFYFHLGFLCTFFLGETGSANKHSTNLAWFLVVECSSSYSSYMHTDCLGRLSL